MPEQQPAWHRTAPPQRRVFVAGQGAVTGFGIGFHRLADAVFAGERAVRPRERTAAFAVPTAVAAEFPAEVLGALGPAADLPFAAACRAAQEAMADAGHPDPGSIGLVLASTKADLSGVVGSGTGLGLPSRLAHRVVKALGLRGVVAAVSCACASGLVALALAARRIGNGEHERILVIGVDVLSEFVLAGFGGLHALDPMPCRPFDQHRQGVSLGDGAGALLLTARARDSIGAVLTGLGGANDACHVTRPDRRGEGLMLAARRALAGAGIGPADVDVIHLHGTGTVANDATEALGLTCLFGGGTPPAFGTKSQTGHTLGAAGVLETALAVEVLRRAIAPANVGLEQPDVDPGLDLVRTKRGLARARRVLKVASGFGGMQAAMVIEA